MSIATSTISSKGQVVIPKQIRDELHWESGTPITLFSTASGVMLKTAPKKKGRRLEDLIGMLKHEGPALSTQALCAPVDYSAERVACEQPGK